MFNILCQILLDLSTFRQVLAKFCRNCRNFAKGYTYVFFLCFLSFFFARAGEKEKNVRAVDKGPRRLDFLNSRDTSTTAA